MGQVSHLPARAALALIAAYRAWLSPLTLPACRFLPSCSEYTSEAIERHGLGRGAWLGLRRLLRCHPLGGAGLDPVP
ncbi:MAG: membrane protein insertion efficiency factor YidD [candidate division NC10 bacterium]|nr:membrane protein insertion efficiency factor YidD [candidate division NC10 bacterium]